MRGEAVAAPRRLLVSKTEPFSFQSMPGQFCVIAPDVKLGQGVVIHNFVNLYGCEIGDGTKIGSFVEFQNGASLGRNCKPSSHSFVCAAFLVADAWFYGYCVNC